MTRVILLGVATMFFLAACAQENAEPHLASSDATLDAAADADSTRNEARWRPAPLEAPPADAGAEALASLGYAAGTAPPRSEDGVVLLDEDHVSPGWNLYTSGHGPVAILMDAHGTVLHEWSRRYLEIWPNRRAVRKPEQEESQFWRRARLLADGDLLVIFEGEGVVRLTRDSTVRWARQKHAHHDVMLHRNGEIWVLERTARMQPGVDSAQATVEDFVTILDADGNVLRSVSLLECFENSAEHAWRPARASFLESPAAVVLEPRRQDLFHTNSIQPLGPDRGPGPLGDGRAMVSFRHLNTIAVIDTRATRVTWSLTNVTTAQHDARRTPSGTVLVFDNLWKPGRSRVVEVDPAAGDVVWEYNGESTGEPFYTRESGGVSLLANGNVLVVETDQGRAFEVTRDGRRVWEFSNPGRAGEQDEFVASIFGMERLPEEVVRAWLD